MTNPINPPAFPRHYEIVHREMNEGKTLQVLQSTEGMTLRDWFAGQALMASLCHQNEYSKECATNVAMDLIIGKPNISFIELVAKASYAYADAMLQERQKEGK